MDTPTLLNMHKLHSSDQEIWKYGYDEDYFGLKDLPAWSTITEAEYNNIKHIVGPALPTMPFLPLNMTKMGPLNEPNGELLH